MKKIVILILSACLIANIALLYGSATETYTYTFEYENKDIIVTSTTDNFEAAKEIADYFAFGVETLHLNCGCETNNIICSLFGHSIESMQVVEINHNVYTTSPKCLKKIYTVEYCTRSSCDYEEKTLIDTVRIATCHG